MRILGLEKARQFGPARVRPGFSHVIKPRVCDATLRSGDPREKAIHVDVARVAGRAEMRFGHRTADAAKIALAG